MVNKRFLPCMKVLAIGIGECISGGSGFTYHGGVVEDTRSHSFIKISTTFFGSLIHLNVITEFWTDFCYKDVWTHMSHYGII